MISDADVAVLCVASYAGPSGFDTWEDGVDNGGIVYGVKVVDGVDVVIFRGSATFLDWLRDLDTWATQPVGHPALGLLHGGFYFGMEDVWREIRSRGTSQMVVGGHSLGAARANILTGLAALDGLPPLRKVLFGEPKAGFKTLADITVQVPGATYRNGDAVFHDAVTDVPYYLPGLPYSHDRELTLVRADPPAWHEWGFFSWHSIILYARALASG